MAKNTTLVFLLEDSAIAVDSLNEYSSKKINIDKTSGQFAIQINTENGANLGVGGVDIVLEFSLDGEKFVEVSREKVTTVSNAAIFDFPNGSGVSWIKIKTEVVEALATLDITKVLFKGKEIR